ncbi:MAG: OmpA family protein [Panacagrimonas sp.]
MKRLTIASAVLASFTALSAFAQDEGTTQANTTERDLSTANAALTNRFYVSAMGSHTWEDKKRDTDEGWGGALTVGKQFSSFFSAEISAFLSDFHTDGVSDSLELIGLGVTGLVFPFSGPNSQNIYGLVGVHAGKGENHPDTGDGDYDTVLADAGLGFLYGPFTWLNQGSLRLEARYRLDLHDDAGLGVGGEDEFGDAVVNLGVLIPIGAQAVPPPPPPPPPVVVVPVADSDGDGVPDDVDQCPDTPAGEPVNEVGCPLPKKECKTPEPGQPVTLEGCAAGDKIVLRGVNFEFDKSRLTSNAKTILEGVGDALNRAPSVTVEIGGHTDAIGTDEYNQKLSEQRAQSVVQYLVGSKNVDSSRMTSAGYGESQPVADNETDAGRELNRRVELKVTGGTLETTPAAPAAEAASEAPAADTATAEPAAEAPAADAPGEEAPADAAPIEEPAAETPAP